MAGKARPSPAAGKYLLFDDALTEEKRGFTLTMNPPARDADPVLLPDRPWESGGIVGDSFASVMEDDGLYKLWYGIATAVDKLQRKPTLSLDQMKRLDKKSLLDHLADDRYMLCYAVSEDGLRWEKPSLGIHTVAGSKRNNVVTMDAGATVFKDPTARAAARFKMICAGGPRLIHHNADIPPYPGYHAIWGATSADGIHWKRGRLIMPWYTDCTNVCYWDDRIQKYVAFVRWDEDMTYRNGETFRGKKRFYRAVARAESRDFWNFPQPVNVLEPTPAELGAPGKGLEIYNNSAVKYPFATDAYFLFHTHYYPGRETSDIHLATSRDGVNYTRWRDPFLGIGQPGAFDSRMTHMATGIVRKGSELIMYYVGADFLHDVRHYPARCGGIGRLRIRLDGFISQDARWSGGALTTVPLRFDGRRLQLNMDANAGGYLKVELLTRAGEPVRGHTKRDADVLTGNDVQKTVTWGGQSDLSRMSGKTLRLKFIGRGVKLYAFQFAG